MMNFLSQSAAVVVTLALLGGVYVDKRLFHMPPADADPYHARVRAASENPPLRVGSWLGEDTEIPPAAVRLLHPNVIFARQYQDLHSGRRATFLLVQCRDARDILGHYPPVCYPGQGWTLTDSNPKDWQVDGLAIHGMQYEFVSDKLDRTSHLTIDNFMILPDGGIARDMAGVTEAARDHRRKFFGAAQVQLITDPTFSTTQREELLRMLVRAHRDLIDEIRSGVVQ